jgi:hypothetical protein
LRTEVTISLHTLLNLAGITKSNFFYGLLHQDNQNKKDQQLETILQSIFETSNKKYLYLNVIYLLRQLVYRMNKKKGLSVNEETWIKNSTETKNI